MNIEEDDDYISKEMLEHQTMLLFEHLEKLKSQDQIQLPARESNAEAVSIQYSPLFNSSPPNSFDHLDQEWAELASFSLINEEQEQRGLQLLGSHVFGSTSGVFGSNGGPLTNSALRVGSYASSPPSPIPTPAQQESDRVHLHLAEQVHFWRGFEIALRRMNAHAKDRKVLRAALSGWAALVPRKGRGRRLPPSTARSLKHWRMWTVARINLRKAAAWRRINQLLLGLVATYKPVTARIARESRKSISEGFKLVARLMDYPRQRCMYKWIRYTMWCRLATIMHEWRAAAIKQASLTRAENSVRKRVAQKMRHRALATWTGALRRRRRAKLLQEAERRTAQRLALRRLKLATTLSKAERSKERLALAVCINTIEAFVTRRKHRRHSWQIAVAHWKRHRLKDSVEHFFSVTSASLQRAKLVAAHNRRRLLTSTLKQWRCVYRLRCQWSKTFGCLELLAVKNAFKLWHRSCSIVAAMERLQVKRSSSLLERTFSTLKDYAKDSAHGSNWIKRGVKWWYRRSLNRFLSQCARAALVNVVQHDRRSRAVKHIRAHSLSFAIQRWRTRSKLVRPIKTHVAECRERMITRSAHLALLQWSERRRELRCARVADWRATRHRSRYMKAMVLQCLALRAKKGASLAKHLQTRAHTAVTVSFAQWRLLACSPHKSALQSFQRLCTRRRLQASINVWRGKVLNRAQQRSNVIMSTRSRKQTAIRLWRHCCDVKLQQETECNSHQRQLLLIRARGVIERWRRFSEVATNLQVLKWRARRWFETHFLGGTLRHWHLRAVSQQRKRTLLQEFTARHPIPHTSLCAVAYYRWAHVYVPEHRAERMLRELTRKYDELGILKWALKNLSLHVARMKTYRSAFRALVTYARRAKSSANGVQVGGHIRRWRLRHGLKKFIQLRMHRLQAEAASLMGDSANLRRYIHRWQISVWPLGRPSSKHSRTISSLPATYNIVKRLFLIWKTEVRELRRQRLIRELHSQRLSYPEPEKMPSRPLLMHRRSFTGMEKYGYLEPYRMQNFSSRGYLAAYRKKPPVAV